MNKLTRKIRDKGYTLNEFCHAIGYSLRWYRTHASKDNKQNELINRLADGIPPIHKNHKCTIVNVGGIDFTVTENAEPIKQINKESDDWNEGKL